MRKLLLAIALATCVCGPVAGQAPPPVPALPDAPRLTSYSVTSQTGPFAVGFALYGDQTDYGNWLEVWVTPPGGTATKKNAGSDYTVTSPSGTLATLPRPITDAVVTFFTAQTGTVQIVGARRPRRISQFPNNQGIAARDINQVITDAIADLREAWDLRGRSLTGAPGDIFSTMPNATARANSGTGSILCFDGTTGDVKLCPLGGAGGINGSLPVLDGHVAVWNGTTGTSLRDGGVIAARIRLVAPLTLYVSTAGSDSTGDGSLGNPFRTRAAAYTLLSTAYDLGGQTVTIQIQDGTYTDSFQVYGPQLIGQGSAGGVIFSGNCTTPTNVLIQPAASAGYGYSAAFGAGYRIQCQVIDQSSQKSIYPGGADIITVGQSSKILLGNPSLFGVRGDLVFGCNFNGFNAISVGFQGYVEFDNDFTIDVSRCQAITTGTTTSGSASITSVASLTGIIGNMNVVATGVPSDAYVLTAVGSTITIACVYTTPCQASANASGVTLTLTSGGQNFLDMGNGAQGYFATNGQPDYSIIASLSGYPFYNGGFFFINEISAINAQAITFTNPSQAHGLCSVVKSLSNVDTQLQGIPYLPCNGQAAEATASGVAVTANTSTFAVGSTTGIKLGHVVTDILTPTGTWTQGAATITVSSGTGIVNGMKVTGPGILGGAVVTNVSGTTITLGGCGTGPRCVSGRPTYLAGSGAQLYFTNGLFTGSSVVTGISGLNITISDAIKSTGTASNIWFQGQVLRNSVYD